MLSRILEPEVMDTAAEAVDYDAMDHSEVNRRFADDFLAAWNAAKPAAPADAGKFRVLDLGTGTAQIPIEICRRTEQFHITAVDLAAHMLALAQRNVLQAGFKHLIRLEHIDAKRLPYADDSFDAVISNSIVHHIPEPIHVFREMARVVKPGGVLFIRDLMRPGDEPTLNRLVDQYAAGANDHQRAMFRASLHAALTLDEVRALLHEAGLNVSSVQPTSDRHWTIT
jgi:ubiquinone/menaquinone biosynthesis C-methylase UbiE